MIVAALGVALAMAKVNPGCGGDADTENGAADIEVADGAEPGLVALEPVALHLQDADPVILTHGARSQHGHGTSGNTGKYTGTASQKITEPRPRVNCSLLDMIGSLTPGAQVDNVLCPNFSHCQILLCTWRDVIGFGATSQAPSMYLMSFIFQLKA